MASRRAPAGAPPSDKLKKSKPTRKPGRPPYWTIARRRRVMGYVCRQMGEGYSVAAGLASYAAALPLKTTQRTPSRGEFFVWLHLDEIGGKEFADLYARARDDRARCWAEDVVEIADDGLNDTYTDDQGRKRTDYDVLGRSKLRIDTRIRLMESEASRLFGKKLDVTTDGQPLPPAVQIPAYVPIGTPPDHRDLPTPSTPPRGV